MDNNHVLGTPRADSFSDARDKIHYGWYEQNSKFALVQGEPFTFGERQIRIESHWGYKPASEVVTSIDIKKYFIVVWAKR
jgi:hypothetical protein